MCFSRGHDALVGSRRSLDCVTVFARELGLARRVVSLLSGPDGLDPRARHDRPGRTLPATPRVAVPTSEHLEGLGDGWADAFAEAVERLRATGVEVVEVDITPLLEAAQLLYGGAFVAERTAAVGDHITAHPELVGSDLDPTVASIVLAGGAVSAVDLYRDTERLERLGQEGLAFLEDCSALLTPTTTNHPTLAAVAADPVGENSRLGRYTNFANLLDCSSLAVPVGAVDGLPFGVMLTGAAYDDRLLAELAGLLRPPVELLVVGAHLSGEPLNHQLVSAGGSLVGRARTAATYRLHALATAPAKPGLQRVDPSYDEGGGAIAGELWRLPASGFAGFVAALPAPMAIGPVELEDGRIVPGFTCEAVALVGAEDITAHGGWRAYRAHSGT